MAALLVLRKSCDLVIHKQYNFTTNLQHNLEQIISILKGFLLISKMRLNHYSQPQAPAPTRFWKSGNGGEEGSMVVKSIALESNGLGHLRSAT